MVNAGDPRRWRPWAALVVLGACGTSASAPAPRAAKEEARPEPPRSEEIFSEPAEYAVRPVSAEVGEEHFAELGAGDPYGAGIAYPVFLGLRAAHPEELGADWRAFDARYGTIARPEDDDDPDALPVGFYLTTDPITRVPFLVTNCALCHADRLRLPEGDRVVMGLGNPRLRIHAYDRAITRISLDTSLDEERLVRLATEEAGRRDVAWPGEVRRAVVRETLRRMRMRAESRREAVERLGDGLPGRVATIEGFMVVLNERYGSGLTLPDAIGWAKIPDVAPYRWRETIAFDAAAVGSPVAMIAEADFAVGVRTRWLEQHRHIATSIHLYLRAFERDLDYPAPVAGALATRGQAVFEESCSSCHGTYGASGAGWDAVRYRERLVPNDVVGTDAARLEAVTEDFVRVANALESSEGLTQVRRTGGWVPRPLVDVWARGLYGHAGQRPDLATLATPPEERPRRFVVEANAPFDWGRVGVRWRPVPDGEEPTLAEGEYLYDASAFGYGVQGHPFLSDLPEPDRRAVLEYLKTL